MQTIKINKPIKHILPVLALIAGLSAFQPAFAEAGAPQDHGAHHGQKSLDWPGIYNGFLPCDDCVGLKTSLALNKNNTYILITQFAGKSPRDFVEKGKFSWSEKDDTIVLTSRDGSKTHHYLVGENTLTKLDDSGNRITGKQAERYILRRNDVTSEPPSHSGH